MDDRASEQLLLTLCRRSTGDVHLDLAELDSLDAPALVTLLRGAETLCDGCSLVLHNVPHRLKSVIDLVGDVVGVDRVRVEYDEVTTVDS